ncbi:PAS domain S-box protein [Salinibacter ruber]|uniref:PAS domain S-box protein n=1 Tax=Salinibacter ruber TaxID=146919 RepID=UPI0011AF9CE7|nr:PAS domain S-box protein [Salinibacter ruber]
MNTPDSPTGEQSLLSGGAGPLDVLLIEGSPEGAARFEACLQESGFETTLRHERVLEEGLEALGEKQPDVVVLSGALPGSEDDSKQAEAVEAVVGAAPELPVVVLVGPEDTEVALQVQKAGVAEALRREALSPSLVGKTLRWALREERMQQKLRQRDAWIRSITDGLSVGVFRAGPTGRIKYANEALTRMLGIEKEGKLIGRDLTEFYANPHQRGLMLAEEGAVGAEVEFEQRGGPGFVGLLNVEVARDAEGRPVHYDGTITDITERKQKEEKLRVLSEAVQQSKEAVIITEAAPLSEPGPRIEYVNEAFEEMTGYSEEEIVGKTPRVLQGPETSREVLDSVREALEAGEEWEHETINYRKDGEPYRVQWNVSPVRGKDGEIEHWVSVQRDVTDQREREEELRRQKSLLEQTQKLAGAWEVDLRTEKVHRSEEARRIHEIGAETDQSLEEAFEAFAPEGRPMIQEAFQRCVEEEKTYDLEVSIDTEKGNRRWVRAVGAPVQKEGGEVVKVAGALQDITERKEAERELRKSRERLQMAVEGGDIGTWDWDLETGEVIFNRQWAEMLGYSQEELDFHFSTWEDLVHPEDLERAMEVLDRYIAGETDTYDPEIRMRTKSGDWKWVQTIGKVIDRDENGEVTRAAGIHLDIDERKKSRRELERYRKYTGRMLDAIDDLFLVLDEDGHFQRWNDTVLEVTGYTGEEISELSALDLVAEEERERVAAKIQEGFEKGHARMEVALLWKDGTRVPYEIEGNLVDHPDGETQAVVIGRDITRRRRQERQIERQNDLFERAQEIARVGAWEHEVLGGEGTSRQNASRQDASAQNASAQNRWTDQVYEIYGFQSEDSVQGENSSVPPVDSGIEQYHPEDQPVIREAFRQAVEEGESFDLELRLIAEGKEKWVRVRGEPQHKVKNGEEKIARVRGTIQDITARKEREHRLAEAKNEAEAANRMKSAFLATMSHEIRTPLTSILGFAEAIEDETEGLMDPVETGDLSSLSQFADLIQRSGERLMKTLTGVLNLSRLEAGEMDLDSRPVDLAEQAEKITEELRPQAKEKGLTMQVKTEGPTWALADEGGVQIVLRNLLSNAIKYTEEGSVEVRAYPENGSTGETAEKRAASEARATGEGTATGEARATGEAVIEVEDTGIGMSASQVEDLFEPFRQESEGVAREYEGTGLGLAVTRETAQQMDGAVKVETQKGEGSRFTVRLPLAEPSNA